MRRAFCGLAQLCQKLALAADRDVLRFKIIFDIDAHLALGQITYMSHGRSDLIIRTEEFFNRLHLGG